MTYESIINDKLIINFIEIMQIADEESSPFGNEIDFSDPNLAEKMKRMDENSKKSSNNLNALFSGYEEKDIRNLYVLYYYGRSFVDGSIGTTSSFKDFQKYHSADTMEEIIRKLNSIQFGTLKFCLNRAKEEFNAHEENTPAEKEKFNKRLKSYTKKNDDTFFTFQHKENKASTNRVIKDIFDKFKLTETSDIAMAKNIISDIIKETNGYVIVDFLGSENFDRLDFIECDDEILKLYWKYSSGSNENPFPPHNIRIDIAFEKLELIKYSDLNFAISLKGFYRNRKEVKQYYCNREKTSKIHSIYEAKHSSFYYELDFDKKQRGNMENFRVTFLPWRYYNILILAKENAPSVGDTTKILIIKNLMDIDKSLSKTINSFSQNFINDEEYITMYGNRIRKIIEKLLKFVLLGSGIMFKENYEKDMVGHILEQFKSELTREEDYLNFYVKDKLQDIIDILEEKKLLEKLNLCSHDNVKHKIDKKLIVEIHKETKKLISLAYEYFKLN